MWSADFFSTFNVFNTIRVQTLEIRHLPCITKIIGRYGENVNLATLEIIKNFLLALQSEALVNTIYDLRSPRVSNSLDPDQVWDIQIRPDLRPDLGPNCLLRSLALAKGMDWKSENNMSHDMWFPTKWHFDKCRLIQACAAFFKLKSINDVLSSSLTRIEYSSDEQRLWSDCVYVQADLSLHMSKCHIFGNHVMAHI